MHDLDDLAGAARDEETFLQFVKALLQDRLAEVRSGSVDLTGRATHGWENHTIEEFLEAAVAWAEDSQFGRKGGLADASPWRKAAVFLLCGKIYE